MAIQFNLPNIAGGIPLKSSVPDYTEALRKGMELGYLPQEKSDEQYARAFANKVNEIKAKYALPMQQLEMQAKRGALSLQPLRESLLRQQIEDAKRKAIHERLFEDLLSGSSPAQETTPAQNGSFLEQVPSQFREDVGHNEGITGSQNEQVLVPGNPSLKRLNDIYKNYPQYRKKLESLGFKESQTVKFDPKTGTSSVITKYPNGEVRIQSSGNAPTQIPLTNAVKTQQQSIIANVDRVKRLVDDIISKPSPTELPLYRKGSRAAHNALVKEAAETYAKAKGWPNTNASIKAAEQILGRGTLESDSDYRDRLRLLKNELDRTKEDAHNVLSGKGTGYEEGKSSKNVIKYIRDASGRIVPERGH